MKIGILSLQGGVEEHEEKFKSLGAEVIRVKHASQIEEIDGIVLPGGESTTIGKLLKDTNLFTPLKEKIESGLPTWGTCAGLILLCKEVENEKPHLRIFSGKVKRNAYGTQKDSFITYGKIEDISNEEIPMVFIRAPYLESVGEDVEILFKHKDKIVAAREKNILVTSFHPELSDCSIMHDYFIKQIQKNNIK